MPGVRVCALLEEKLPETGYFDEKNISAQEAPQVQAPWIPSPDDDTRRTPRAINKAGPGPQETYGLVDILTLKRSGQFQRVFSQGRRAASGGLSVFYAANHLGQNRYGLVATTKAGNAVVRNKLRRWMREFIRKPAQPFNPGWDIIIHIGRPKVADDFGRFTTCLSEAFSKGQLTGATDVR